MRLVRWLLVGAMASVGCAFQAADPASTDPQAPREIVAIPGDSAGSSFGVGVTGATLTLPRVPGSTPSSSTDGPGVLRPAGGVATPAPGPSDNPNPSPWTDQAGVRVVQTLEGTQ